jgi:DNA-binding XRE family transcriptional regulator
MPDAATRFRDWLAEAGLTQTELAAQLGVARTSVNFIANGKPPGALFLWKFFARYGEATTVALFDTEAAK